MRIVQAECREWLALLIDIIQLSIKLLKLIQMYTEANMSSFLKL